MKNVILALLLTGSVFSTASAQTISPQDELDIKTVFENSIRAVQAEDVSTALGYIHPSSPLREQAGQLSRSLLEAYDFQHELEAVDLGTASAEGVEARVTLTTRKVNGPDFRDRRLRLMSLMRKTDEGWKIYTGRIEKIEYLDGKK
ncbi:MAG: hypothetical protein LH606_21490 [Cytophagaceae bacterium]|nr:hypothetical protein [Cytophagaceae bacterium]